MLNPARLRHRVKIQKPVETQDSTTGAMNVSWQDVATVWSAIEALSVKELIAAQAEDSKLSARITIRYRNDIDHTCRLLHEAKNMIYNIEGILADKDSGLEYLTLPCSEGIRYTQAPDVIPVVLTAPSISGVPNIGSTLTASQGVWVNNPQGYVYQWYLDDLPITGANGLTFIVPNNPNGILTFGVVTENDAGFSEESFSAGVIILA